jgi:hypothetical protein
MSRQFERLIRVWRLAETRRDLIAVLIIQSRIGRVAYAVLEGAVARG